MKMLLAAALIAALPMKMAFAGTISPPAGDVILTVSGDIENTNASGVANFDQAMLEAMEGRTASMETPWTEGVTEFGGPYLKAILATVGAQGKTIKIIALNDYSAEIPVGDAMDYDTILALTMNGKPMSVRDKGPLFMIYPFDKNPELYNEKYFSRSVWQIKAIEVID